MPERHRQSKENVITITDNLRFIPSSVTINAGDTIRCKNSSLLVHTVTADPKLAAKKESVLLPKGARAFDSGNLDPNEEHTHRFTIPGKYRYFCIPHKGTDMIGEITVR